MFDGPDWVGKTTQVNLAAEALRSQGHKVWTTRVNGGTPIGEALRQAMFGDYARPPETDLYIHLAQQYALQVELEQRRRKGAVILVDRSPLSVIAYQVYGGGLAEETGYRIADEIITLFKPELVVAYTAPRGVLKSRRLSANHASDYFERQPADYFERVIQGYAAAAQHYQATIIDAAGDKDAVHEQTMKHIGAVLAETMP